MAGGQWKFGGHGAGDGGGWVEGVTGVNRVLEISSGSLRSRRKILVFQPLRDAPVQSPAEAAEGLVDRFEITAGGPGDLLAGKPLVVSGSQDLPGAERQGIQTELQGRLAGSGGFIGFVEGFGNGFDGFRREEEREAGTAAAGFKDLPGGDAPRPGPEGPAPPCGRNGGNRARTRRK